MHADQMVPVSMPLATHPVSAQNKQIGQCLAEPGLGPFLMAVGLLVSALLAHLGYGSPPMMLKVTAVGGHLHPLPRKGPSGQLHQLSWSVPRTPK